MAVFRIERTKDYTVMSNHHLRNKELSLKAKGLLSQMLSLPEDWDYTLAGLSHINKESIEAIRTAIAELEKAGYIVRSRERDEKGRLRGTDYVIYEQPHTEPESGLSTLDYPTLDNPTQGKPTQENPMQLIKDIQIIELQNTDSFPFSSATPEHSGNETDIETKSEKNKVSTKEEMEAYRKIIKDNIDYNTLIWDNNMWKDRIDEIVDLMLETVCTAKKYVHIARDDYPAELVKSKFMKLNSEHIRFVLDCMQKNTTKIHSIKQYLLAVLFNAPSTIENYYESLVTHDMSSG